MKSSPKKKSTWQDHYSRRAKAENYPARSVYKLKEIQQKYHLLKKGDNVLDLGCSPGSWLLFAADQVGKNGKVTGIDLKPVTIRLPTNVVVYTGDIRDVATYESIENGFNVILSDMAPATTGNKMVDSTRSYQLCETALSVAQSKLLAGGAFICKIFQGEDFKTFSDNVKQMFHQQKIFKPQSSRKISKEIYIIGFNKK